MKYATFCMALIICLGVGISCSSGGSGASSVQNMSDLPKLTGPVSTSGLSTSSMKFRPQRNFSAATTGMSFSTTPTYTAGSSRIEACNNYSLAKEMFKRALAADKTLCYIAKTTEHPDNAAALSGSNYADGEWHTYALNFGDTGNEHMPTGKIPFKFQIVKEGDRIASFKMYGCFSSDGQGGLVQSEYLGVTIAANGKVNATDVNQWIEASNTGGQRSVLTGTLGSDGAYTDKQLVVTQTGSNTQGEQTWAHQRKATLTQYSDLAHLSGFEKNIGTGGQSPGTWIGQMYSIFQLINGTSTDFRNVAMGDGSSLMDDIWDGAGDNDSNGDARTVSWGGDAPYADVANSAATYYNSLGDKTLPTVEDVSVSFSEADGETWPCPDVTTLTEISVNQDYLNEQCAQFGEDEGSWINCWELLGNQQ